MNWTRLAIVFSILFIGIYVVIDINLYQQEKIKLQQKHYNQALDRAIDDSVAELVEVRNDQLELNKEDAIIQFYESLYANFGILGNELAEENLKNYIPIILVTDDDGFYIQYTDIYTYESDENVLIKRWSEKLPYVFQMDNLVYHFTLSDLLTVYDISTDSITRGYANEIKELYPGSILSNDFDTVRRNAIISSIEKQMDYYINQYNSIAEHFGITYKFWLPAIEKTDWHRTIDDRSLMVLFQGYPIKSGQYGIYNQYAIGGARLKDSIKFVITEENDGIKYYHKKQCTNRNNEIIGEHYSKEECAAEGAYPCMYCNP